MRNFVRVVHTRWLAPAARLKFRFIAVFHYHENCNSQLTALVSGNFKVFHFTAELIFRLLSIGILTQKQVSTPVCQRLGDGRLSDGLSVLQNFHLTVFNDKVHVKPFVKRNWR